jgi:MFS family permease
MSYLGCLLGSFLFTIIADNKGRKFALICGLASSTIGSILIIVFSGQLSIIFISLFLIGFGIWPSGT